MMFKCVNFDPINLNISLMAKLTTTLLIILALFTLPATAQEFSAKEWTGIAKCANSDCFTDAIKAKGFKYTESGYDEYHPTMIYSGPKSYGKEGCTPLPNKVSRTLVGRAYVLRVTTLSSDYFMALHDELLQNGFTKSESYQSEDGSTITVPMTSKSDPTEIQISLKFVPDGCTEYSVKFIHWSL